MNLQQFVQHHTKEETKTWLLGTELGHRMYKVIGSESHTDPLIGTILWQVIASSPAYSDLLTHCGVSAKAMNALESIVVGHWPEAPQYSLVVLEPGRSKKDVASTMVETTRHDLEYGWMRWQDNCAKRIELLESARRRRGDSFEEDWHGTKESHLLHRVREAVTPERLFDAVKAAPLQLLVAQAPKHEFTACPSPAWSVGCPASIPSSTAGARVRQNGPGPTGVTASYHALDQACGNASLRRGTQVVVGGMGGVVESADRLTDSCFVKLLSMPLAGNMRGDNGPLVGVSPRWPEKVSFDGLGTGKLASATVIGWDKDVPFGVPNSQQKIYTDAVTNVGDSGAAIVNDDDYILGFALARTGLEAKISYSAWIWADSVFKTHGLRVI